MLKSFIPVKNLRHTGEKRKVEIESILLTLLQLYCNVKRKKKLPCVRDRLPADLR